MAKKEEPAGESAPMWIVSFADLVTLMMSFFVVLYALKQGGTKQRLRTAAAIKARFGYVPPLNSTDPLDREVRHLLHHPQVLNARKRPGRSNHPLTGAHGINVTVKTIRNGKQITAGGAISFHKGSAALTGADVRVLRQIAAALRGHSNVLMVKGNVSADELALHPNDRDGLNLSYRRAMAACNALVRFGMRRKALRPVACGPFEPIHPNAYGLRALRANRRVEIFSTDRTVNEFDPATYVPATRP